MKNKKSIRTLKCYLLPLITWIAFILMVIYIKRPYYFDGHPRMNFIPALNLIDDVKIWKSEGSLSSFAIFICGKSDAGSKP